MTPPPDILALAREALQQAKDATRGDTQVSPSGLKWHVLLVDGWGHYLSVPLGTFACKEDALRCQDARVREPALARAVVEQAEHVAALERALKLNLLANEHTAPGDCWSTGPMDGSAMDSVCIGCAAIKAGNAALTAPKEQA